MVCGTFTINQIPNGEETGVVARFRANVPPPIDVKSSQDADGTWTVIATFPPCPANTTHDPGDN